MLKRIQFVDGESYSFKKLSRPDKESRGLPKRPNIWENQQDIPIELSEIHENEEIIIPKGFLTDFRSGPWFSSLINVQKFGMWYVIHDWLYQEGYSDQVKSDKEQDYWMNKLDASGSTRYFVNWAAHEHGSKFWNYYRNGGSFPAPKHREVEDLTELFTDGTINPIIIVPGIQGTKLVNINKKNFDTVWSGIRKFFDNLYDIILSIDGRTDLKKEVIIERQDVEDLAYSEIINFLQAKGYPVYIFGYDWRKSNLESGGKLSDFIEVVKRKHPDSRINFLTHSMGALVFSGYLRNVSQEEIKSTVEKVIFTVPPFLGSVEAMYNLVIGKSKLFNSSDDFRKIARTFPSVFELCPVYNGAVSFKGGEEFDIYDYANWQQNPNHSNADAIEDLYEERLDSLKNVRSHDNKLFDLSSLDSAIRKNMIIVAGINEVTQSRMEVDKNSTTVKNLFIFSEDFEDKAGDGTVHINSANTFSPDITTLTVESRWIDNRLDGRGIAADWHSFFLNNGRVQNVINRFLLSNSDDLSDEWYNSIGGGVSKV